MAPDFEALEAELARAREEEGVLHGERTRRAERALAVARGEEHAVPCEGFPLHRPTDEEGVSRRARPTPRWPTATGSTARVWMSARRTSSIHSAWAEEARRIHSVHPMYDDARWQTLKHYFLILRDDTIECLARGFTVRIERARYEDVVMRAVREVNGLDQPLPWKG